MKIQLLSDIHLEFYKLTPPPDIKPLAPVLVLAGDIQVGTAGTDYILKQAKNFQKVIYIPGNHEYYHNDMDNVNTALSEIFEGTNVDYLVNDITHYKGYTFICSTLWSYIPTKDNFRYFMKDRLSDFNLIKRKKLPFGPDEYSEYHEYCRDYISLLLDEVLADRAVVVTHHSPSFQSTHPRFEGSSINCCFATDLDELIERKQPAFWLHGHMHDPVDYKIGSTRVVASPQGYPGETRPVPDYFEGTVIDLC